MFFIVARESETHQQDNAEASLSSHTEPPSELVCEIGNGEVRIVEERENSLIVRINCTSSDDAKRSEPQTRRGFRGRGFRSQRGGRGRIAMANSDGPANFYDRGPDFNNSSDLNTGITNRSEEEDKEADSGGVRTRGRWRGSGWRRGGAGRYFRQRYGERPDRFYGKDLGNANSDISSSKASDTPLSKDQESNPPSVSTPEEQNTRSTHAEDTASANSDHKLLNKNEDSVGGMKSAGRRPVNRYYIVRRSSVGRRSRRAGPSQQRVTSLQSVKTEGNTSAVPRSSLEGHVAEDWDAEIVPLELTNNETMDNRTETETERVEIHTTLKSSGDTEELGETLSELST